MRSCLLCACVLLQEQDEDVAREADRIANGDTGDDIIVLNQLRKVFAGKKAAVRCVLLSWMCQRVL